MAAGQTAPAQSWGEIRRNGHESSYTWAFILGGALASAIAMFMLNDFRYALAAQLKWTKAAGRVTGHEIGEHRGSSYSRRSRRHTSYSASISYEYATPGGRYLAGPVEVTKSGGFLTESGAVELLRRKFPEGGRVTVYYQPGNPGRSSLGLAGSRGFAFPFLLLLAGATSVYLGIRKLTHPEEE